MTGDETYHPSVRGLLFSWFILTGQLVRRIANQIKDTTDNVPDIVKNGILDSTCPSSDDPSAVEYVQALPPVNLDVLAGHLHGSMDAAVRRAAEIINDDPSGCWDDITEERVLTVFRELGMEVLREARDLRITEVEEKLPPTGAWARKFRRMLAEEGRWPPADLDLSKHEKNPPSRNQIRRLED